MNQSSRSPRSQNAAARWFPAFAAVAVVGAVVIAGVAGGLGDGGGDSKPKDSDGSASTVTPPSIGLPPATQAIAVETTEAPLVTTSLSQPLAYGSAGDSVLEVQQRLEELGFFVGPVDGQFGNLTKMAVWAFEKLVMRIPRAEATGVVTDEMWQQMQQPMRIEPRRWHSKGQTSKNHTEVYLPEQVVIFFQDDEAKLISHMSSGTGEEWREEVTIDVGQYGNENGPEPIVRGEIGVSVTPGGVYSYDRMIQGLRQSALGGMWNPAYFNYGIAIHGAMNVPLEPASHGCIRVPLTVGETFQDLVGVGDNVWVWDGVKEPEIYGNPPPTFNRIDPDYSTTTTTPPSTVPPTTLPTPTTQRPAVTAPPPAAPTPLATPAPTPAPPPQTQATTTTSAPTTTTAPVLVPSPAPPPTG